jgi:hypothetical protein
MEKQNERPIKLFPVEIREILEERKTQFSRPIIPQPMKDEIAGFSFFSGPEKIEFRGSGGKMRFLKVPFGVKGDRLWVKESWWMDEDDQPIIFYAATDERSDIPLNPPSKMPRKYSRITIQNIRTQVIRIQNITTIDIVAHGISPDERYLGSANRYRNAFIRQWNDLHGKEAGFDWDSNPWVFLVDFSVFEIVG